MPAMMFTLTGDGDVAPLGVLPWESEDVLQDLIGRAPQLIGGAGTRLVLAQRELGIADAPDSGSRWSLDHLFLDAEGVPTLVEVKRSSDTRIRREVVGQLLDYAANAVKYLPPTAIRSAFESRCDDEGLDASALIDELVAGSVDTESYWTRVATNLEAGRLRLVFVADVIPPELQRIVEFLNEQMQLTEVLAIRVQRFAATAADAPATIVAERVGDTSEAQRTKAIARGDTAAREHWTFDEYFQSQAELHGQDVGSGLRELWDRFSAAGETHQYAGYRPRGGLGTAMLTADGTKHWLFKLEPNGDVSLTMPYLRERAPFDDPAVRAELLRCIASVVDEFDADRIDGYPRVKATHVANASVVDGLLEAFAWARSLVG
ncbi:MAG: hypothetical protein KDC46_00380 [Thermoleophilia bacterium]|nr:hypothetical protein [Thermoleophilia bacterium]